MTSVKRCRWRSAELRALAVRGRPRAGARGERSLCLYDSLFQSHKNQYKKHHFFVFRRYTFF